MAQATERRRATRHDTMGVVVYAFCEEITQANAPVYTVADLSNLGALLVGQVAVEAGTRLTMCIEIPGGESITVTGTVARCFEWDGSVKVGVQFEPLDTIAIDFIQDALLAEVVRKSDPVVLVIADGVGSAIDLWADLDEVGCDARVVPTLDEGFLALHARDLPVSTLLMDVREGMSEDTIAFAEYALVNMPQTRVLLLGAESSGTLKGARYIPSEAWNTSGRRALFAPQNLTTNAPCI